jgi:hypothetical protein
MINAIPKQLDGQWLRGEREIAEADRGDRFDGEIRGADQREATGSPVEDMQQQSRDHQEQDPERDRHPQRPFGAHHMGHRTTGSGGCSRTRCLHLGANRGVWLEPRRSELLVRAKQRHPVTGTNRLVASRTDDRLGLRVGHHPQRNQTAEQLTERGVAGDLGLQCDEPDTLDVDVVGPAAQARLNHRRREQRSDVDHGGAARRLLHRPRHSRIV